MRLFVFVATVVAAWGKITPTTDLKMYIQAQLPTKIEDHFIVTADNYVNHAFRLTQNTTNAPVVVLQHGLLASAWCWAVHEKFENNIAAVVWNMGYEVWLTNSRGNLFSRNSTSIPKPEFSKEFWNFTYNEMGDYDVKATVDYILGVSGRADLSWVGWSQGTTQMWIAGSAQGAALASKINVHIALSPVAYMAHSKSLLLTTLSDLKLGQVLEDAYPYGFLEGADSMHDLEKLLCTITLGILCQITVSVICGTSPMDDTGDILNLVAHFPAGTSTKDIVHYEQFIEKPRFGKYDYGSAGNMKEYGQKTPPDYNLGNYQIKTAFFIGQDDYLAEPKDVATLEAGLTHPSAEIVFKRTYDKFSHLTWMVGDDKAQYFLADLKLVLKAQNPV